jgi:hypothetical protein
MWRLLVRFLGRVRIETTPPEEKRRQEERTRRLWAQVDALELEASVMGLAERERRRGDA